LPGEALNAKVAPAAPSPPRATEGVAG